jgi:hypothetical protein
MIAPHLVDSGHQDPSVGRGDLIEVPAQRHDAGDGERLGRGQILCSPP